MSRNLKKKIENSYVEQYGNHGIDINDIKSRLMFKAQEQEEGKGVRIMSNKNPNKKSHLATWLCLAMVVIALTLVVIFVPFGKGNGGKEGAYQDQVINLSVNPSVSLATDEKGVVVAVYGDNDEGKMVIEGEELVGLTAEVAIDKVLEIEFKCGYFVKSDDPKYNNITVSVSGKASPELEEKVEKLKTEVTQSLEKLGVNVKEKITMVKNDAHDALVTKACELDKTLVKEEVTKLEDDKILALISAYYLEAAKFPTQELENLYNQFKESEIKFANYEAINQIEGGLKTLSAELQKLYNESKDAIRVQLDKLEQAYYDNFVKTDCAFQKAFANVKEAKAEVLKLKAEVASMEDGAEKTAKQLILNGKETALEGLEDLFDSAQKFALLTVQGLREGAEAAFTAIDSVIAKQPEIEKMYQDKKAQVEDYLNTTKDKMFENFEAKYAEDIKNFGQAVATQKTNLINSLKDYAK